ncbi:hypothetical protein EST38_g7408 [Candolleomyces aberdarensis]|uniref:BTB domain-containing protein n=1 Tax=Candolleomyces aberdarensis TaxID=2316362 RepID=A0A4Q2DI34_9AGAR|nr:hypothetical protein EST38_g7408 [Candolleomyces aberdarensis]
MESSHQSRPQQRGIEEIDIIFEDSNITRAAFEICISRLYGGGPPLHIFSSLVSSTSQPLSPSFPVFDAKEAIPEGHHPATPRFLLSVLATAIYLCIPTVASQALSLIFKTLGPHTVIPYLNFALGKPIDSCLPLYPDPEAAVGLEHVAVILEDESLSMYGSVDSNSEIASKMSELEIGGQAESSISSSSDFASSDDDSSASPSHHYGPISDKIGEASIVAADTLFVKSETERYDFARSVVELRRREGIVEREEHQWDKMFNEAIYYENMAMEDIITISHDKSPMTDKPFVTISTLQTALWNQSLLRHQITSFKPQSSPTAPGSSSSKDKELGFSFPTSELKATPTKHTAPNAEQNINYYPVPGDSSWRMGDNGEEGNGTSTSNPISMEDLFTFSHSPCAASARQSSNRSGTRKVATDKDAEICSTEETFFGLKRERYTALECGSSDRGGKRRWTSFPPCRFAVEFWDIDALKEKSRLHSQTVWYAGSLFNVYLQVVKKKGQTQLGIYLYRQSTAESIPPTSAPSPLITGRALSEKSSESSLRVDHPAINRGTSYPSLPSTSPTRSTFVGSPTFTSRTMMLTNSTSPPSTPGIPSPGSGPTTSMSPSSTINIPYTTSPIAPQQPYRDSRSSILAYFMISCASATGSSQMRFTSAPDLFAVGQSWGWKTSSLRTEEYMEVGENATLAENRTPISSLRATVVLGLV